MYKEACKFHPEEGDEEKIKSITISYEKLLLQQQ